MKGLTFEAVRELGLKLPNTEEATAWGSPCLKVNGHMFCVVAINKSAEPNSLGLSCEFADRDALVAEQPDIYYTASHYENNPCVLVRLSRVKRDVLADLLVMAHRFVSTTKPARRPAKARTPSPRRR